MKKRSVALLCAVMMIVGIAAGGTIAWLTDHTAEVKNTFTVGTIDIDLTETTTDYKMIPGKTIAKDPKVTVEAGSEASYVFVKVDESTDPKLSDYISYTIAAGWTQVEGTDNVYYRQVEAVTDEDVSFDVLEGNKVTVKDTVTKEMMDALEETGEGYRPTLTFTAYAIQSADLGTTNISEIWAMAQEGAAPQG